MSPEDLGNKSLRRNPLIADLLHRIAFIEKAGTGIRRMRDGARELGYPEPTFAADNFFTALFRPITLTDEKNTPQEPRKYPASTPQVPRKSWQYSKLLLQFRNRGKSCKRQRQSKTVSTSVNNILNHSYQRDYLSDPFLINPEARNNDT